jgi:Xaa-Pro dipeptidase
MVDLINLSRLEEKLVGAGVDVVVAAAPENTYYLAGVFIRTQVSIRERMAVVVWPLSGEPTFVVCNIEESLARHNGTIKDVRTYVEYAETPIAKVLEVLRERKLEGKRIGVELGFLPARAFSELQHALPNAILVPIDEHLEAVRAVKTTGELDRIVTAFRRTEAAINEAWAESGTGDREKDIADRMLFAMLRHGASGLRHMTLTSGENTVHVHATPGDRTLRPGETILTDTGAHFSGFSSDMARMGIVGKPSPQRKAEYDRYREIYVKVLHFMRPGIRAKDVYAFTKSEYERAGFPMTMPHVGHSLTRMGGHENPMLHPRNDQLIEPGMLFAVEPGYTPRPDQRYHIEDLVLITETGNEILTDWQSTEEMIELRA